MSGLQAAFCSAKLKAVTAYLKSKQLFPLASLLDLADGSKVIVIKRGTIRGIISITLTYQKAVTHKVLA